MRVQLVGVTAMLALVWLWASPAVADPISTNPAIDANLMGATAESPATGATTDGPIEVAQQEGAASSVVVVNRILCADSGLTGACRNPYYCAAPPGSIRHTVLRSDDGGVTFFEVGEACLVPGEAPEAEAAPPEVTPDLAAQAFADLSWPESPLTVQPPGGRTLVNLATNFLTTNITPTTQTVELLGQQVDIEATPTTWTWHHGDGTTQSTDQPGTAYPELSITHTYRQADTTATPSVDTTYSGRFRVNAGPWQAIPTTRTITGSSTSLEIVPATPQLVAP